jgi:hypothetical protein
VVRDVRGRWSLATSAFLLIQRKKEKESESFKEATTKRESVSEFKGTKPSDPFQFTSSATEHSQGHLFSHHGSIMHAKRYFHANIAI